MALYAGVYCAMVGIWPNCGVCLIGRTGCKSCFLKPPTTLTGIHIQASLQQWFCGFYPFPLTLIWWQFGLGYMVGRWAFSQVLVFVSWEEVVLSPAFTNRPQPLWAYLYKHPRKHILVVFTHILLLNVNGILCWSILCDGGFWPNCGVCVIGRTGFKSCFLKPPTILMGIHIQASSPP